jgi:hypothetical protein
LKVNATASEQDRYVNDRCICNFGYLNTGNSCAATCPSDTYSNGFKCVPNCPETASFIYGTQCLSECPTGTYIYNGECKDACPLDTYLELNETDCVDACAEGEYIYGNACVEICPVDTYVLTGEQLCRTCDEGKHIYYDSDTQTYSCEETCPNTAEFLDATTNSCVASCPDGQTPNDENVCSD